MKYNYKLIYNSNTEIKRIIKEGEMHELWIKLIISLPIRYYTC